MARAALGAAGARGGVAGAPAWMEEEAAASCGAAPPRPFEVEWGQEAATASPQWGPGSTPSLRAGRQGYIDRRQAHS
jgi:hypothetical protein